MLENKTFFFFKRHANRKQKFYGVTYDNNTRNIMQIDLEIP